MNRIGARDVRLPRRRSDARKGQNGRLLIVGGSEDYVGAPLLAAKAAFRAGCDLVEVAAPQKVAWAINTHDASIISRKLRCSSFSKAQARRVLELARPCDAVLLGNGIGRGRSQQAFVRHVLRYLDKPVVIDADALHATRLEEVRSSQVVCTPHAKEYEALMKNSKGQVPEGVVVLRKGPVDVVLSSEGSLENRTGVQEMAVAGSGDVLAGLVAGFLAQGLSPSQSAVNAAFLNGRAGERARRRLGSFSAEELLSFLRTR